MTRRGVLSQRLCSIVAGFAIGRARLGGHAHGTQWAMGRRGAAGGSGPKLEEEPPLLIPE
jgi:hypothetical protein